MKDLCRAAALRIVTPSFMPWKSIALPAIKMVVALASRALVLQMPAEALFQPPFFSTYL
jgi:hypothetical protein